MPTSTGQQINIITRLIKTPKCFNFFQALRLLKRFFLRHKSYRLQFRSGTKLQFQATALNAVEISPAINGDTHSTDTIQCHTTFISLAGQSGIMPLHYNQLLNQQLSLKNTALRDFLGVFEQRMLELLVAAWEKNNFALQWENHNATTPSAVLHFLMALSGHVPHIQQTQSMPNEFFIYYTGLLAPNIRNQAGLAALLNDYFDLPIKINTFQGQWLPLLNQQLSIIGADKHYNQLGCSTLIGHKFWDLQNRFNIEIGTLDYSTFKTLLPSGNTLKTLIHVVRFYINSEHNFSIKLLLRPKAVPKLTLKAQSPAFLGWNTWLGHYHKSQAAAVHFTPNAVNF